MSELDEIRKRKFEQLKASQGQSSSEGRKVQQQIAQLEGMVKPLLSKEALTRYGTIKTAYPERAVQVLVVIAQLVQAGKLQSVNDEMLKKILIQLTPKQRETKITGI